MILSSGSIASHGCRYSALLGMPLPMRAVGYSSSISAGRSRLASITTTPESAHNGQLIAQSPPTLEHDEPS
jgi:hypothetical protein